MSDETANTDYGSWPPPGYSGERPEVTVSDYLGEFAGDYDVSAMTAAWVDGINAALPDGWSLNGSMFFGPYPMPKNARQTVEAAVDSVSLDELAEQFDTTRED
jgi:hypothetical protein